MSNHNMHVFGGVIAGAIAFFILYKTQLFSFTMSPWDWPILALIIYLFSIIADIDHDLSVANKIWNTTAGAVVVYSLITGKFRLLAIVAGASIIALEWVKHRGICHSPFFAVALAAPLWTVKPVFAIIAVVASISHLALDGELFGGTK